MMNLCLILPAIIGFSFAGIILLYFFRKERPKEIILSSFFFIFSGFLCQIIFTYGFDYFKDFASEYNEVFSIPIFTIFATATGIFFGNMALRCVSNDKEKREISILFINVINSQLRSLGFIYSYLISYDKENVQYYIEIYQNRLADDKYYQTAFNKIGIYNEQEIDVISQYSIQLQEYLSYLQKLLIQIEQNKQDLEKLTNPERFKITYQEANQRYFIPVIIAHIITMLFACLVVYKLSINYSYKKFKETQEEFIRDYKLLVLQDTKSLVSLFEDKKFYHLDKKLGDDLFNKLKYIRKVFIENKTYIYNKVNEEPLFMCLLWWNQEGLEIESEIKDIYPISYNHCIVAFDDSKEKTIKRCLDLLGKLIKERAIEKFSNLPHNLIREKINILMETDVEKIMEKVKMKYEIVSPWGVDE